MEQIISACLKDSIKVKEQFITENMDAINSVAEKIVTVFTSDRKLMLCGNGGSAADAQHLAGEFVNRFEIERPPLPAISLSTDTSILTCIGNDYSYDEVFAKQVKAIGQKGDMLIAISTSGNSRNVLAAAEAARTEDIYVVGLTGNDGGRLKDLSDMCLVVKSRSTPRIQESHILAGHIICKLVDYYLFQQGVPVESIL